MTSVREAADRKYRCDGCGAKGVGSPVVTGRVKTGIPTGTANRFTRGTEVPALSDTWAYAWLCEECAQPYTGR